MAAKKPVYLSASRIDTFLSCTALYSAKYIYKLPDKGNDGSNRGNVVHEILELLLMPKHKPTYDTAILHDTCLEVPALRRLINRLARRYGVADDENIETIDAFIMVALKNEFFGPKGTKERFGEKDFELDIPVGNRSYRVKGFIDQTFIVEDKQGVLIEIRDFKTSKAKMDGEKETFNYQALIYQLALRHLYPKISRRRFHFLFLKFPRVPRQEQPSFTDDQLDGFEWHLVELQSLIDNFSEANALDNPAAINPDKKWLCGKEGLKKDGTQAWICSARNPLDYWVLEENGNIVVSAFTKSELPVAKNGQVAVQRRYPGCPYYCNANGKKRSFQ